MLSLDIKANKGYLLFLVQGDDMVKKVLRFVGGKLIAVRTHTTQDQAVVEQTQKEKVGKPQKATVQKQQSPSPRGSGGRQCSFHNGGRDKKASRQTIWGHR